MGKYTHLSTTERRRIGIYLDMGLSITAIAKKLSRPRSTLYREINRNGEEEGYFPMVGQFKTKERCQQKRSSKLKRDGILRDYVIKSLRKGWSPEQISGRMKYHKLSFYACPETIYQFIYRSNDQALYACLAYQKPRRQKRFERQKRRCRYGKIRLISQRPQSILSRKQFGHWEGDTIQFKGEGKKVITTLVERKSRMVFLIKNNSKYSREVMKKIKEKLASFPEKMCQTITFDQGVEFADYKALEERNKRKIYYCQTHSPWQKGSNENMNGRLRWYLPKETNLARISQADLDRLAARMNRCPRKCLGYKTPQELFIQQYKNDCRT